MSLLQQGLNVGMTTPPHRRPTRSYASIGLGTRLIREWRHDEQTPHEARCEHRGMTLLILLHRGAQRPCGARTYAIMVSLMAIHVARVH